MYVSCGLTPGSYAPMSLQCSFQMALGEEAGSRTWAVLIFIFTSFIFPRK